MNLCKVGREGLCDVCGRQMKNAAAKRHCSAYAEKIVHRPQTAGALPVGTTLSVILSFFRVRDFGGCSCKSLRRQMDMLGANGCWRDIRRLSSDLSLSARKSGFYCPAACSFALIACAIVVSAVTAKSQALAP